MNYKVIRKVTINKNHKKNQNIDFDPLGVYPNNMELGKPILLVDLGYATFYRFNATKTWYKHAHPEEKEELKDPLYDWGSNEVFMEKFNNQFVKCIIDVANKYKIPRHNIILAQDCSSCNNWRFKLFKSYKITRKEQRDKKGFDGAKVFKIAHEYTFQAMAQNYGFKLFKHKEIEADDINAIIAKYYQKNFPGINVYILATDKDYLQLSNDKLHLIDFKARIINDVTKDALLRDGKYQLWHKIISGDKSDDIAPLKIQRWYIRPNIKTGKDTYINATKKDAETLAKKWKKFLKDIEKYPGLIKKEQLELSKQLIDFKNIPNKFVMTIEKKLKKLF